MDHHSMDACFCHTAIAAHPDVDYVVVQTVVDDVAEVLVVAEPLLSAVAGEHTAIKKMKGRELERITYQRPFDYVEIPDSHFCCSRQPMSPPKMELGLVHQSPAFGAGRLAGLSLLWTSAVNPIAADGTFLPTKPVVGGTFLKRQINN
jgi:isoleucyl-tRNA synthetase